MRNLIKKIGSSATLILAIIVFAIVVTYTPQTAAQGVSDPAVPPGRVFVLQDIVENFNFGLNAGGELTGFGIPLGEFSIQDGEGILSGNTSNDDDGAAILATVPEGFGGTGEDFIGFSKTFTPSVQRDPNTGESITTNAIDARGFSTISYFLKNDGNNSDSSATVSLELVIGDGSIWSQFPGKPIAAVVGDSSFNDFERIEVTLQGSIQGVQNGFIRTAAPTDGSTGSTLTEDLLSKITKINVVFRGPGDTAGTRRAIFVDNIVFVNSELNLAVGSSPFTGVPISRDFTGITPFDIPNQIGNSQITLCTPISFQQGDEQFVFNQWILDSIPQEGVVDAGGELNCLDVKLIQNSTLTTSYQPLTRLLSVRSTPVPGISFSGTPVGGITDFGTNVEVGTQVTLEAPIFQQVGELRYNFRHWEIDGILQPEQQNVVVLTVEDDVDAIAVFEQGDLTLAVTSVPVDGVTIEGADGGIADYLLVRGSGAPIQLSAPPAHQFSGVTLNFQRWQIQGAEQPIVDPTDPNVSFSIIGDARATAIFDLVWILNSGWTLISTPVELSETTQNDLLSKVESPLWFWDGKKFQTAMTVEVGKGYWAFSNESEAPIVLEEASPQGGMNNNTIELNSGWNLFGIKDFDVIPNPLSSSNFTPLPDSTSAFWTWDLAEQKLIPITSPFLQLFKQNTLFPGLGYWVYLTNTDQNE